MTEDTLDRFSLTDRVCVVTGGAGLLGMQHARAIASADGLPVIWDISQEACDAATAQLYEEYHLQVSATVVDIADESAVSSGLDALTKKYGRVDALINNAANNPKAEDESKDWARFEHFPMDVWMQDIRVGLTGAFLCSRTLGSWMASHGGGVILNIASDLGMIAPDQRIYRDPDAVEERQPVKPVTYSVVKHGLIGLTRYLATYWPDKGVRANALCPGGIYNSQPDDFVERLTNLIPMGRMADKDDYTGAVLFMLSDASRYMNGSVVTIDGGRTCW
jgi:NAD(P)-dependent dehydrogenase (short-subunit alcohol dehydrogenase family)